MNIENIRPYPPEDGTIAVTQISVLKSQVDVSGSAESSANGSYFLEGPQAFKTSSAIDNLFDETTISADIYHIANKNTVEFLIELPNSIVARGFKIWGYDNTQIYNPTKLSLFGSSTNILANATGANLTPLVVEHNMSNYPTPSFFESTFSNTRGFKYYKVIATSGARGLIIEEFKLYGTPAIAPLLEADFYMNYTRGTGNPPPPPAQTLILTSGTWSVFTYEYSAVYSVNPAYNPNGNRYVYYLSGYGDMHFFGYNYESGEYEDIGGSHPNSITRDGDQILLNNGSLGIFTDPYFTYPSRNFVTNDRFTLRNGIENTSVIEEVNSASVIVAQTTRFGQLEITSDNINDIQSQEVVWRNVKPISSNEYHEHDEGITNTITSFMSQGRWVNIAIQANSDGTIDLMYSDNGVLSYSVIASSTVTIDDQKWNSFIMTRDTTGLIYKVYINTVLAITHTFYANPFSTYPLRTVLYGGDIANTPMDFNTHQIKIWRKTLSQSQVTVLSTIKIPTRVQYAYLQYVCHIDKANSIDFNNDGTKVYVAHDSNDNVEQYDLATAYRIDTVTNQTTPTTTYVTGYLTCRSMKFNHNGTAFYIFGQVGSGSTAGRIGQIPLSTPYDITTAGAEVTLITDSETDNNISDGQYKRAFNGTEYVYVNNSAGALYFTYEVQTPFNTKKLLATSPSISALWNAYSTAQGLGINYVGKGALFLNSNGTKAIVGGQGLIYSTFSQKHFLFVIELKTPYLLDANINIIEHKIIANPASLNLERMTFDGSWLKDDLSSLIITSGNNHYYGPSQVQYDLKPR